MTDGEVQSLGGWLLVECIGRGGMGEVWRAERPGPGGVRRFAAVKRLLRKFQSDRALAQRFVAEARTMARLDHPNVVRLLDYGESPELYLVLEYVDGASLHDWLKRGASRQAAVPVEAALFAIAEAAAGLDAAHRCVDERGQPLGIVHRDVSPANVLISAEGAVKVNDFGVVRAADNTLRTEAGLAVGKLAYMAPEQARGEPVDRRADIFALGVCLWELLALRPLLARPNPADTLLALAQCNFPPPSRYNPSVRPELDALVRWCLRGDKGERPDTADALARALRTHLAQTHPGYASTDFARAFRQAIPRLAEQERFASAAPSGAAFTPLGSAPSAGGPPPSPAVAPSLTPATGLSRPGAPTGPSSPMGPLTPHPFAPAWAPPAPGPNGGWASMPAAPPAQVVSAPVSPPAVTPAAPVHSRSKAPAVAIAVGAVALLALLAAGGALFFSREQDESPTTASPKPPLSSVASAPFAPSILAPPVVANTAPAAPFPSDATMVTASDVRLAITAVAPSCIAFTGNTAHGVVHVTPTPPGGRGIGLEVSFGAAPFNPIVAECVSEGTTILGRSLILVSPPFDVPF